ncbi:MAG: ABC transporter permease [Treponema sp.]|jgi:simple sugar transport system permease protein|nr:ABC transporter permease [Treponema sp.]
MMSAFFEALALFLQTAVQMGTHILFAVLGGILCEKIGNMNLGIEGMMLLGASVGYAAALGTSNPIAAILAAGFAGAVGACIYALITVTLRGNQVVTGLILTIFGTGVSGFLGKSLSGKPLPEAISRTFAPISVPVLHRIPVIGRVFFEQSPYVLAGMVLAALLYMYFQYTRIGLNARAVGEHPGVADASGIPVTLYKYLHIVSGGFLCGLGGAYLSLVFVPRWQENITAGAGWIAVALIIFSTWNPLKAIFAAYIFGALKGVGFKFQNSNLSVFGKKLIFYPQLLDMLPYIATILVLIIITRRKKKEYQPPAGLGIPYFREER